MKPKLRVVENWSRWCECHNGALPIFDLNGYSCQKCKQIVCVNCIYKTEKGFLCADCIKMEKPKRIFSIAPLEKKVTKSYLQAVLIYEVFTLIATIIAVAIRLPEDITSAIIMLPLLGLILLGLIALKFQKTANKAKISESKIIKLDKKIKKRK